MYVGVHYYVNMHTVEPHFLQTSYLNRTHPLFVHVQLPHNATFQL